MIKKTKQNRIVHFQQRWTIRKFNSATIGFNHAYYVTALPLTMHRNTVEAPTRLAQCESS